LSCSKTKNVGVGDATFELPVQASLVSVNDGLPLVDIQGLIDNLTNQLVVNVPYVNGSGTYAAYSSAVVISAAGTGEGGDANGFSISYPAGNFGASGTIPVTITVDGDGVFNAAKQLFGVFETIATIDFQSNGDNKGNIVLASIGGVLDRNFADANHKFVYIPVIGEDGNIWLNNNLGAHYSNINHASYNPNQQATAHNDHLAYGSLYQWGRYSGGHELINWTDATSGTPVNSTTFTNATTDTPVDALFILEPTEPKEDWRVPQNNALWQGETGVNNPCPQGYRIPKTTEYISLRGTSAAITNYTSAASSNLAFSTPGYRKLSDGTFDSQSTVGRYWTTELWLYNSIYSSQILIITNTHAYDSGFSRAHGISVRCIKDY